MKWWSISRIQLVSPCLLPNDETLLNNTHILVDWLNLSSDFVSRLSNHWIFVISSVSTICLHIYPCTCTSDPEALEMCPVVYSEEMQCACAFGVHFALCVPCLQDTQTQKLTMSVLPPPGENQLLYVSHYCDLSLPPVSRDNVPSGTETNKQGWQQKNTAIWFLEKKYYGG